MQAGIKGSGPRSGEKKTKKGPKMGPRVKLGLRFVAAPTRPRI